MIVALSSGGGGIFNDEKFYKYLLQNPRKCFKFTSFLNDELSTILSCNKNKKINTSTLEEVKKVTNNNPALVSIYLNKNMDIAEFKANVHTFVFEYISSTFKELEKCVDRKFHEGCDNYNF